ncbi:RecQ4 SF II RNA helicase, partial [Cryptosporidium felis]
MSAGKRRTIGEVYDGDDLSKGVLSLPLTPFSEEFMGYKEKLDKAIFELKLVLKEQVKKDDELDLDRVLGEIRNSKADEEGTIPDEIRQGRYFGVFLEVVRLEESRSEIMECFIKWKNDHYYTGWEDLSQPPQKLRELWLQFKDRISRIILDSRRIGSRPLPRSFVNEKNSREESFTDETAGKVQNEQTHHASQTLGDAEAEAGDSLSRNKMGTEVQGPSEVQEERQERRNSERRQRKRGSSGLWGPKLLPKSKNRYISGVSVVRSVRKRVYNSNGRLKVGLEGQGALGASLKPGGVAGEEEDAREAENISGNFETRARNLKGWERVEEKRREIKRKRYLFREASGEKALQGEGSSGDPLRSSSNFSEGCKSDVPRGDEVSQGTDLVWEIKRAVEEVVRASGEPNGETEESLQRLESHCLEFLREKFGFEAFREGQLEAILSVLVGKPGLEPSRMGSILILPTGYGKSLCFQFLSLLMNGWYKKVTLVVTPLISLMQDQLRSLNKNIRGAAWNSSVTFQEKKRIVELLQEGRLDVLFVTPESTFSGLLSKGLGTGEGAGRIGLLCVDEAHCVSEWGHSFRPEYYSCVGHLVGRFSVDRVLGITATAPLAIIDELKSLFGVEKVIQPHSDNRIQRENLHCKVVHLDALKSRAQEARFASGSSLVRAPRVCSRYSLLWDYLKYSVGGGGSSASTSASRGGAGREVWSKFKNILIYVWQRSEVEALTNYLRTRGANALYYHGMMSSSEREMVQKSFMENQTNIFVATTSFGMGIDKKDIDAVIHWNLPNSLEQYIQETGRCARQLDGFGVCLLILSDDDYRLKRQIISGSLVDKAALRCVLHVILGGLDLGMGAAGGRGLEAEKEVEFEVFPIEMFKGILNTKQVEDIEVILHYLRPYLEYLLDAREQRGGGFGWRSYLRGSPYLKLRCFGEDFSSIRKKSAFFGSLSKFSTECSGVVTVNVLEACRGLGRALEDLEDEIELERSLWRMSAERLTNKQCVILMRARPGRLSEPGTRGRQEGRLAELFLEEGGAGRVRPDWRDVLAQEVYERLSLSNREQLWKLDVAYFYFQRLSLDRRGRDSLLESYFADRRGGRFLWRPLICMNTTELST